MPDGVIFTVDKTSILKLMRTGLATASPVQRSDNKVMICQTDFTLKVMHSSQPYLERDAGLIVAVKLMLG